MVPPPISCNFLFLFLLLSHLLSAFPPFSPSQIRLDVSARVFLRQPVPLECCGGPPCELAVSLPVPFAESAACCLEPYYQLRILSSMLEGH